MMGRLAAGERIRLTLLFLFAVLVALVLLADRQWGGREGPRIGSQETRRPDARQVLSRLRNHYGSLRSCALVFSIRSTIRSGSGLRTQSVGLDPLLLRAYFQRPHWLQFGYAHSVVGPPLSLDTERAPYEAILDPLNSPMMISQELFMGFGIAGYFSHIESKEIRAASGRTLHFVSLKRRYPVVTKHQRPTGSLRLDLWIDAGGRLARYECTARFPTSKAKDMPPIVDTLRGEVREEKDNVPMPEGFFAR